MLLSLDIAGRSPGPTLLIVAGVHGDEWEPMAAVRRLAATIDRDRLSGRVTLIPVANESAFRLAQRAGEDGLDLARTCPGDAAGSPTQRIAAAISEKIQSADALIDLHTGGRLYDILPLSGYMLHSDPAILKTRREMAQAMNLPLIWGTTPNLDGRTLSVARDVPIPSIYCEYGGPGYRAEVVEAYTEGCLNVMGMMKMLDRPAPTSRVRWVVEDPADQSGHLQVQHPAAADGFFEASARLGDRVTAGQPIGVISDILGRAHHPVAAAQTGILLLLRAVCSVKKGDTLAAIAAGPA